MLFHVLFFLRRPFPSQGNVWVLHHSKVFLTFPHLEIAVREVGKPTFVGIYENWLDYLFEKCVCMHMGVLSNLPRMGPTPLVEF